MKCASIESSLAAYVGGDLRPATEALVSEHLAGCSSCSGQVSVYRRAAEALRVLSEREVEPPTELVVTILERVHGPSRRVIPVPPIPPEALRVLAENKDALASAAGTALVVGGAAWALWRAARRRTGAEPAPS